MRGRPQGFTVFDPGELAIIKRKAEGIAEGGKRPLAGICLCCFEREFMRFARGEGPWPDRCRSLPG
jgi:hypothetical protein